MIQVIFIICMCLFAIGNLLTRDSCYNAKLLLAILAVTVLGGTIHWRWLY
jgi:hypothetical protein